MNSITEKHRPRALAEIVGNERIVKQLASFARKPVSKAFLFSGAPGVGKTSAGYALARELGADVDKKEWGGLHEIASGEMTAETVRELFRTTLNYSTWHGSGWKIVIANEADGMSDKAAMIWLDCLEHLPAKTVIVFTTNEAEKLPRRFRDRCECYVFKAAVAQFGDKAQSEAERGAQILIDRVWQAELGHNHSPKLAELDGYTDGGQISYRGVLQSLEPLIRLQREEDEAAGIVAQPVPETAPIAQTVAEPIKIAQTAIDPEMAQAAESLAAMYARKGWVMA